MTPAPRAATDRTLRLPDGRTLGYADYGPSHGLPVLFFHGAPGSRRSIFADMAEAAVQRGLRLLVPERPGYGLSDPLRERTIAAWANDVRDFTHALGIERYRLIGFSMGSLFAQACAQAMPEQVERLAVIGGLAPLNVAGVTHGMAQTGRALFELAAADPDALRQALAPLADSAAGLFATMAAVAPAVDQALLAARRPEFETDFAETLRCGIGSVATDFVLTANEWPFPIAQIQVDVDLWVGTEDRNTPPAMTHHLAAVLPHSKVFELPGAGHFCLYTHWPAILDRLLA